MKKLIIIGLISINLFANTPLEINGEILISKHPLEEKYIAYESGGTLDAIDSYSDGIGVLLVESPFSEQPHPKG